jgi:SAM-dependent methyltransferase
VGEQDLKQVSRAIWEQMAPGWEQRYAYFEAMTRPVTERMLARLNPSPGEEILDLAAGTGIVGFAAAAVVGPEGKVIVSDFAEAMVDAAARRSVELGLNNVECRVLDAEGLELPDGCVDGVVCRWGYMLMADPGAALRETRRVLREGGAVACAVFSGPERNPWVALPGRVLVECGHMPPPEAGTPGIFALADRGRLRDLFVAAGFGDPSIEEVDFIIRADDVDDHCDFLTRTAGAIGMAIGRLDSDQRHQVRAEISDAIRQFSGDEHIELPGQALVVSVS